MKNPNGPSREEMESWQDELEDRERKRTPPLPKGMSEVFIVSTYHNRRGVQLQAVFADEAEAMKLKAYFDSTQNGWDNFDGGDVEKYEITPSFEVWKEGHLLPPKHQIPRPLGDGAAEESK